MHDAFAIAAPGIEALVAGELRALGASPVREVDGGAEFSADDLLLARVNLELRTASRVLVRLARFRATAFHELERAARKVEWERILAPGTAYSLRVTCKKSRLYHSDAVAARIADAIGRRVGGAILADQGEEEDSEAAAPQLFVIRLDHDRCTLSADSSGELLHRRGYRRAVAKAPLRETLAAAMLIGAGYDPVRPLADPMCGSGTIAIEAALFARRIAPGIRRRFAAESWPIAVSAAWSDARAIASARALPAAGAPIIAGDRDEGAIEAAMANAVRAGVDGDIEFRRAALSRLAVPDGPGLLISNPPYGARIGETKELRDLYARLGQVAEEKCAGWGVALLSADRGLERQTRLAFEERWRSSNGGIPVRLVTATAGARTRTRTRR